MVREIEELRGEVATLTTRVSMLAKESDSVNASLITRQLALDLEEVLLKTIFAGKQNLNQLYSQVHPPTQVRLFVKDWKYYKDDPQYGADFKRAWKDLDGIAKQAGFSWSRGNYIWDLNETLRQVKGSANTLAHDDARTKLQRLPAQERATLPCDSRL